MFSEMILKLCILKQIVIFIFRFQIFKNPQKNVHTICNILTNGNLQRWLIWLGNVWLKFKFWFQIMSWHG
jgi:hypothetical protein